VAPLGDAAMLLLVREHKHADYGREVVEGLDQEQACSDFGCCRARCTPTSSVR